MEHLKITDPEAKKRLGARLARIEGQVHGVRDMIDREELFKDILQQMAAAREALNKTVVEFISDAAEELLLDTKNNDTVRREALVKLVKTFAKYG